MTLRIFYAGGPGDIIDTYRHWTDGTDDPSQVSITYSGQFFDVCREFGARAYVLSRNERRGRLRDGQFTIVHRPVPLNKRGGVFYHIGLLLYGLRIVFTALLFRANVAVIAEGSTHWFILWPLTLLKIAVIPTIHCVLWPDSKPSLRNSLLMRLNRRFLRKVTCTLSASQKIADQVNTLAGNSILNHIFLPIYRREVFDNIPVAHHSPDKFTVLFLGRIERDKGVFDLLTVAEALRKRDISKIIFVICGIGSQQDALSAKIDLLGLSTMFELQGYCNQYRVREELSKAQCVIVPTRSEFPEGFNMVTAEAILGGRPVITSRVVPAAFHVSDAVVEATPDDPASYENAIVKLYEDKEFYESKRSACMKYQEQFYHYENGWGAAFRKSLLRAQPD